MFFVERNGRAVRFAHFQEQSVDSQFREFFQRFLQQRRRVAATPLRWINAQIQNLSLGNDGTHHDESGHSAAAFDDPAEFAAPTQLSQRIQRPSRSLRRLTQNFLDNFSVARLKRPQGGPSCAIVAIHRVTEGSIRTRLRRRNEILHHGLAHQVWRQQTLSQDEVVEFFLIELWT